jgi:hypothetical protein
MSSTSSLTLALVTQCGTDGKRRSENERRARDEQAVLNQRSREEEEKNEKRQHQKAMEELNRQQLEMNKAAEILWSLQRAVLTEEDIVRIREINAAMECRKLSNLKGSGNEIDGTTASDETVVVNDA